MPNRPVVHLFSAAGVVSPAAVYPAPAALLLEADPAGLRVLAVGRPSDVASHPACAHALCTSLPRAVLLPALVNAHAHLDLTLVGPTPHDPDAGFVAWIDRVRTLRTADHGLVDRAVQEGVGLARAGGTGAVGDIAGAGAGGAADGPARSLGRAGPAGVSFIEFFGIGTRQRDAHAAIDRLADLVGTRLGRVRVGLSPHAPYSVGIDAYRHAVSVCARTGAPLATHLAESAEEAELIARGTGPMRAFLERLGLWSADLEALFGRGATPVGYLSGVLREAAFAGCPVVAVHVNRADDDDIASLAEAGASVVYCPRASAYFAAERVFGPHRYRDMLAAGVNVALGTDSVLNVPPADLAAGGLSVLDEARFLFRRDGTDPMDLVRMATVGGARALGMNARWFDLAPGSRPVNLLAVPVRETPRADPARAVLTADAPGVLLFDEKYYRLTGSEGRHPGAGGLPLSDGS